MSKKAFLLAYLILFSTLALATNTHSQLQAIFKAGMTAVKNGDYQLASEQFRKMLKNNPNLLRPRLELARVLYENGDYVQAKYHFEQVLSSPLPHAVRQNIKDFLLRIRQQLPSLQLSIDIAFNEKIPSRAKTTYLFGIPSSEPVRYRNTGIRRHRYNFIAGSKIPINHKTQTFTKLKLEHSDSDGSKNATTYLKTTLGKHYKFAKAASFTPEIGFHHLIYQDHKLYNGKTLSFRYFKPVSLANYLTFTYSYKQLNYAKNYQYSSGSERILSSSFIKLPSVDSRLELQLSYIKYKAQDKSSAFKQPSLNFSYSQDLKNGWTIGFNLKANRRKYQKPNLFDAGIRKKDKQKTLEITILNRLWRIKNTSPKLTIGKTKNSSNIDIYGKSEPYIKLGFSQQF